MDMETLAAEMVLDDPWVGGAAWSPDGKAIAYLQGGPRKYRDYDPPTLATILVPVLGLAAEGATEGGVSSVVGNFSVADQPGAGADFVKPVDIGGAVSGGFLVNDC